MKILIFLLLLLSFSALAQSTDELTKKARTFKRHSLYKVSYDKFEDKTTAIFNGQTISGVGDLLVSNREVRLSLAFGFSGQELKKNIEDFVLLFESNSDSWTFLKDQRLFAVADDKRFEFGIGLRDSDIGRNILGRLQTKEVLGFRITRSDLETMANSKNLEVKVGNRVFKLKSNITDGFKNMLTLSKSN